MACILDTPSKNMQGRSGTMAGLPLSTIHPWFYMFLDKLNFHINVLLHCPLWLISMRLWSNPFSLFHTAFNYLILPVTINRAPSRIMRSTCGSDLNHSPQVARIGSYECVSGRINWSYFRQTRCSLRLSIIHYYTYRREKVDVLIFGVIPGGNRWAKTNSHPQWRALGGSLPPLYKHLTWKSQLLQLAIDC